MKVNKSKHSGCYKLLASSVEITNKEVDYFPDDHVQQDRLQARQCQTIHFRLEPEVLGLLNNRPVE